MLTNLIFFLALGLFVASAVRLAWIKAVFSPQFIAAAVFVVMGILALVPQMKYSVAREEVMATRTQIFVALVAVVYFISTFYMRAPTVREEYPPVRWKFLSRRTWLLIFFTICLADPLLSLALHGSVGLVKGNQSMGAGGGNHSEVFTPVTFIAWACASMAVTMLMTDFLFSFSGFLTYLKRRVPDVMLVGMSLICTTLSGNRFVLLCQLVSVVLGLAMFSRLKVWMLAAGGVFAMLFFVIVGNFRFGVLDVVDNLRKPTGIAGVDTVYAWTATYFEPTFPNLDNFIKDQPGALWGMGWLTTVMPSELVDAMGLERNNSADWLSENELYAYHGLTFRTMYPDLMMDFGLKGSLVFGVLFTALGVRIYNRSLASPYRFVLFLTYSPLILLSPLAAAYYSLPNLVPFALLFIVRKKRRSRGVRELLPDEAEEYDGHDEPDREHAEVGAGDEDPEMDHPRLPLLSPRSA